VSAEDWKQTLRNKKPIRLGSQTIEWNRVFPAHDEDEVKAVAAGVRAPPTGEFIWRFSRRSWTSRSPSSSPTRCSTRRPTQDAANAAAAAIGPEKRGAQVARSECSSEVEELLSINTTGRSQGGRRQFIRSSKARTEIAAGTALLAFHS